MTSMQRRGWTQKASRLVGCRPITATFPPISRFSSPLTEKRRRSWVARRSDRRLYPFVVCSTSYGETTLMRLLLKNLQQIVIDHDLGSFQGKPKKELARMIIKQRPEIDFEKYSGRKGAKDPVVDLKLDSLKFSTRGELIDQLSRFTMFELQEELKERRAVTVGSKMEIAERLATLFEEEKLRGSLATEGSPLGPSSTVEAYPKRVDEMDDDELRSLLHKRMGGGLMNFSRFLDVRHFADCLLMGDHFWKAVAIVETKEKMVHRISAGIEALQAENETFLSLAARCDELKVERLEDDPRQVVLQKLKKDEIERLNKIDREGEGVKNRVFEQLKLWLEDIQSQLSASPDFQSIIGASPETVVQRAQEAGFNAESPKDYKELLRGMKMIETQFFSRSLALLSAQIIHRTLTFTVQELGYIFDLLPRQIGLLHESTAFRSLVHISFLHLAIPAFESLCEKVEALDEETRRTLEQYKKKISQRSQVTEEEEVLDPPLSIGVVFGVSSSRMEETFSSIRCLLDHLQSAPYDTDPLQRGHAGAGICIALYCIRTDKKPASVERIKLDEFLSLDGSLFAQSQRENQEIGQPFPDFADFLKELGTMHQCISLTPSLDIAASENAAHYEQLKEMDSLFVGSSSSSRLLANNRYGCLTYLRKEGFIVPPMYRILKAHLADLEVWNRGFDRWCEYHKMDRECQSFHLLPSNVHERLSQLECKGIVEIVSTSRSLFEEKGMEEVIIQPKMPNERYTDFSCVVMETKKGPIALAPTEFEELPRELVRAFSSPLRCHTPPQRTVKMVQAMRNVSVRAFKELNLSGYACIHGRVLVNPQKEDDLKNEELKYPRPIPEIPYPEEELELPKELMEHMKELHEEKEKELDALVESYDTSRYTLDALRYFEFLDGLDAKKGITRNRYRELEATIEYLRHRRDAKKKDDSSVKQFLKWQEALDDFIEEMEDKEPSIASISRGEDFSISIAGVDTVLPFAVDSLIFQQAAVSGLSHGCVLGHLLNLKLPKTLSIPETARTPQLWNPFYPDTYVDEQLDPREQRPAQVWILCGGDGLGHQASLASGLTALLKFRNMSDVQPYLFILDSGRRLGATPEVLKGLYDRRNGLLQQGVPEDVFMEECTRDYLASPRAVERRMPWKPVWCVHDAHCLVDTIDEALEASDHYRELQNSATMSHSTLTADYKETLLACQRELDAAGVQGVCALWAGEVDELPPTPRMMTMDVFASEAATVDATVFLAVHGDIAQDGTLQDFLSSYNLVYTGCNVTASQLCGNKREMSTYLNQLKLASTLPNRATTLPQLKECSADLEKAEEFFQESKELLDGCTEFCIKPTREGFGCGVARVLSAKDLQMYAKALERRWEMIPGELLSGAHCTVPMPKPNAEDYLLEPYIFPTHPSEPANLSDPSTETAFVEVSFGLVGEFGQMWVLTPSLVLTNLQTDDSIEDRVLHGRKHTITPIPESLVDPRHIETAKKTVAEIADSMGLAGVARVDAFMSIEDGELVIIEIDTTPFLGEHSPIFQQAALEDPPMLPDEVFRQILEASFKATPEMLAEGTSQFGTSAEGGADEDMSSAMGPWDDNEFWESDDLAEGEPFEVSGEQQETLSNLWGSDDEEETHSANESLPDTG